MATDQYGYLKTGFAQRQSVLTLKTLASPLLAWLFKFIELDLDQQRACTCDVVVLASTSYSALLHYSITNANFFGGLLSNALNIW